jgi:hypothetical protein
MDPWGRVCPCRALREQSPILALFERVVKLVQRGNTDDDRDLGEAIRPNEQACKAEEKPVPSGEVGRSLPRAIQNHELVLEQQHLGQQTASATGSQELGHGDDQVDEKNECDPHAQSAWSIEWRFGSLQFRPESAILTNSPATPANALCGISELCWST